MTKLEKDLISALQSIMEWTDTDAAERIPLERRELLIRNAAIVALDKAKPPRVTVNAEQELFTIPESSGYSCLGFDVCRERTAKIAEWLNANKRDTQFDTARGKRGTLASYSYYCKLLSIAQKYCLAHHVRCPIELTQELIGLEGNRIEVIDKYGETRRFIVGKSTGWMPCHLEIARSNSSGGGAVTGAPFQSIRMLEKAR